MHNVATVKPARLGESHASRTAVRDDLVFFVYTVSSCSHRNREFDFSGSRTLPLLLYLRPFSSPWGLQGRVHIWTPSRAKTLGFKMQFPGNQGLVDISRGGPLKSCPDIVTSTFGLICTSVAMEAAAAQAMMSVLLTVSGCAAARRNAALMWGIRGSSAPALDS